jgi:hypothetical protein
LARGWAAEIGMARAQEVLDVIVSSFALGRSQGLDVEVGFVLGAGWTVEERDDGYAFAGPWSAAWEDEVWRLARFLSYRSLLVLRGTGADSAMVYELVSAMDVGHGFRATFRAIASET